LQSGAQFLLKAREKTMTNLPRKPAQWLEELVKAYADAQETIPFGKIIGTSITEEQLFHLAPHVAIKFRGMRSSKANTQKATEAALSTYVANEDREDLPMKDPQLAFCLCYLAAHLGLGLLSEAEAEEIMAHVEADRKELSRLIDDHNQA
jgi:hypothetical protein